jgi:hypothetical protein
MPIWRYSNNQDVACPECDYLHLTDTPALWWGVAMTPAAVALYLAFKYRHIPGHAGVTLGIGLAVHFFLLHTVVFRRSRLISHPTLLAELPPPDPPHLPSAPDDVDNPYRPPSDRQQ